MNRKAKLAIALPRKVKANSLLKRTKACPISLIELDEDISARIQTDATWTPEERKGCWQFETGDATDYLALMSTEFDGNLKLLSLSLQKQDVQIQERLAERELQLRRNRRVIREQLIKTAVAATLPTCAPAHDPFSQAPPQADAEMEALRSMHRARPKLLSKHMVRQY